MDRLIEIYRQKYPSHDAMIVLRSMIYFDDAEDDNDPELLMKQDWEDVKAAVREAVKNSNSLK